MDQWGGFKKKKRADIGITVRSIVNEHAAKKGFFLVQTGIQLRQLTR